MIHPTEGYNKRIQDNTNQIPEDEPVFLLRGQDVLAPSLILDWASRMRALGGDPGMTDIVREHAHRMILWQQKNGAKIPDLPPEK